MKKAPVNKIIPFSNVDGPGNRTSIFFQGCPFNCLFCHNPETIHLCRNCGTCIAGCPVQALSLQDENVTWNSAACVQCDQCIKVCPYDASPRVRYMTVEEVMTEIRRTRPYIGGITTSGGECTQYPDFLTDLFHETRALGLTALMDSNGSLDFSKYPDLLDASDGVMLDVKAVSAAWSDTLIRYPRETVLRNLDYLLEIGKLYEVRTLIFPDRDQDNEETVRYVAEQIKDRCFYKIIRYRPFGVRERFQNILGTDTTDADYAEHYAALARSLGALKAYVI
ncbi:MAG: YjjW family glycine radical enzyme activase [Clostridia bacterium]|nr:YjjW family glycine radical enzyme activase [Clostridia bacterium]